MTEPKGTDSQQRTVAVRVSPDYHAQLSMVAQVPHAKNANRADAEIGLRAVEHLLGVFTAARLRLSHNRVRCAACGSYHLIAGVCESCGWVDEEYEPPPPPRLKKTRRPKGEHSLTSDISTFIRPEDVDSMREDMP